MPSSDCRVSPFIHFSLIIHLLFSHPFTFLSSFSYYYIFNMRPSEEFLPSSTPIYKFRSVKQSVQITEQEMDRLGGSQPRLGDSSWRASLASGTPRNTPEAGRGHDVLADRTRLPCLDRPYNHRERGEEQKSPKHQNSGDREVGGTS